MNVFKKIINQPSLIILSCIIVASCTTNRADSNTFVSDFNTSEARSFIGPEYWSNPLQDWQVENGSLICLTSGPNRNVHHLTHKLDSTTGNLNMQVDLQLLNLAEVDSVNNWIGFRIGSKGEFNDYRNDAIFGKGLNVGITTNGNLFIGDYPKENKINDRKVLLASDSGAQLSVILTPNENNYQLTLSLSHIGSEDVKDKITAIVSPEEVIGDLVLVSHFQKKKGDPRHNDINSVSFKNWKISGTKTTINNSNSFGPILFSQYTLSRNTLKLTAQMAPVILNGQKVQLETKQSGNWINIAEAAIDNDARTAEFKIEDWDGNKDIAYRLTYDLDRGETQKETSYWEGTIRKEPNSKEEIVVAGFTGNAQTGFPNTDLFEQVAYQNPDVLFFSGDQLYEPNGGYGVQYGPPAKASLDYLRKWYMYGWAYRDLLKDRPSVSIPDDHDVYHGNIWGAGGVSIPKELGMGGKAQDNGGYKMPPDWVNMVQRTQTSHLPDPFDPSPVAQGIGVYYTDMVYGGVSFAILEDRKFKSAPRALIPKADIYNGWSQVKGFDMKKYGDVTGAKLLGDRQLNFLETWASDWSNNAQMKVLLSQTIFSNVATIPKEAMSGAVIPKLRIMHPGDYPPDDKKVSDLDSNGWPQTGRNKAVGTIRKGFAFHLAGDQHLGSTIQYGLDEYNDSGYAFCVPSISNFWPRRWYPLEGGKNRKEGAPKYTGEIEDGFGNKMTVHAVSNPLFTGLKPAKIYDRAAGYGIVRFHKNTRDITIECWPRQAKPQEGDTTQYPGWPIKVNQMDNFNIQSKSSLPQITVSGMENPVIQIVNENTQEIEYSIRLNKTVFTPKITDPKATYTVKVGDPDQQLLKEINGIKTGDEPLTITF